MMGNDKFLVPSKFINALIEWNAPATIKSAEYDKRVTIALLLMCVTAEDLANGKINDEVKNFIFGKYDVKSCFLFMTKLNVD